jgi:hypothetical protein
LIGSPPARSAAYLGRGGLVDLDGLHDQRVGEVRDVRIVEREVAVLADPDHGHVEAAVGDQRSVPGTLGIGIGVAPVQLLDSPRVDTRPARSATRGSVGRYGWSSTST